MGGFSTEKSLYEIFSLTKRIVPSQRLSRSSLKGGLEPSIKNCFQSSLSFDLLSETLRFIPQGIYI